MSEAPPGAAAPAPAAAVAGGSADGMGTFLTLWGTQTLSLFGTAITQFGVTIWLARELYPRAEQRGALALGLSATALAFTAPMIVFAPIAGAFADRHDRRRILILADSASFALTAALVALLAAHALSLGAAVALLAGYSLAASFHNAAFDSSIPLVAPTAQLGRANGMMMSSYALAQLLAPALAATLIALPGFVRAHGWPLGWVARFDRGTVFAFAADALTFAIAGIAVALLSIPRPARPAGHPAQPGPARGSLVADVREGFAWIARRRPFLWLIGFGSIANFMLAPLMLLLPVMVRDHLRLASGHGASLEAALATVTTAGGLGAVLGGVAVSVRGVRGGRRPQLMLACILGVALGEIAVAFAPSVALAAAALLLCELPIAPLNAVSATMWQSLTPPHMLARAMSTRRFIAQSFYPLGTLVAGWLAVPFEPRIVVAGAGAVLALACAAQLADRRFAAFEERMREAAERA